MRRTAPPFVRPAGIDGRGTLDGVSAEFGGPAVAANPLDEAGAFSLTSDVLPAEDFPLFAGEATSTYRGAATVNPFGPVEGSRYAGALKVPVSYQRIGRTVDLTGVPATGAPTLRMKLSYSTLLTFHHVIVEAAPSGTDQWTTLRDLNGRTSSSPPTTLRPRLPPAAPPVPQPLPDAGQALRGDRHHRVVERVHRRVGRVGRCRLRPVAVRRPSRST